MLFFFIQSGPNLIAIFCSDPYRPLWDLNVLRRVVYSLDWLSDPRCVILSMDDGTLRTLSLSKAVYDVPATGKPFVGGQQQGLSSYFCSSFPIWSVQASRLAGLIAYCCADGSTLNFQLTTKAVEKDSSRYRASHFVCGSVMEEDTTLVVNSPLPNVPFPMKKSINEYGDTPRTIRGFLTVLNQAKRASSQAPENQTLAICYETILLLKSVLKPQRQLLKATAQSENQATRKMLLQKLHAPMANLRIHQEGRFLKAKQLLTSKFFRLRL
ncbi:hypothetical protein Syun_016500 [Stephania yunnanensis]|uniref:Uncharacterized protein n=1 Tax=Stephania yunnanensis TaxID=152371 RepID=A0AAP0P288_9MAGN